MTRRKDEKYNLEIVASREPGLSSSMHIASIFLLVLMVFLALFALIASIRMRRHLEQRKSGDIVINTEQNSEEAFQLMNQSHGNNLQQNAKDSLKNDTTIETMIQPKQSVYDAVLRFHIRANSDRDCDQAIKMSIKDSIVKQLQVWEREAKKAGSFSKEDAITLAQMHLADLEELADDMLLRNGYNYKSKAYLTREEFPIRSYGDLTFPAGIYDALRIDLGEARGHNWWCMLYPSLCFVDATYSVVSADAKEELSNILVDEDYQELLEDENTEVEIRSGIWDTISGWLGF